MVKTHLQVLFVEDALADAELAVHVLEREGFDVHWTRVETEVELRAALAAELPEIVLSDYSMPGFDGSKALRVVLELAPQVPFIFISGTIGEEAAIESLHRGATDYVLKSGMKRLPTAVRRALAERDERARARAVEQARNRLSAILEATSDFVAIYDAQSRLSFLNTAWRNLVSCVPDEVSNLDVRTLHPAWVQDLLLSKAIPAALARGTWQGESALLDADGDEIPVSQVVIAHRGEDGEIDYVSTIARDVRERQQFEEQIAYLANYDALTGLPNRNLLATRVAETIAAGDTQSGRLFAVLVIDVDRFRLVNDGFGHDVGDALLKAVGERLQCSVRVGDTVARLGADTFAALAVDIAHIDSVMAISTKIARSISGVFDLHGNEVHVNVNIGASVYPRDGTDFRTLMRSANAAMHRAKSAESAGFRFFAAEMTREAAERVELENALRNALARRELEVYYQPQVDLDSMQVFGMEALLRWKHSERGWISPGVFIPIAEHSNLICGLGDWVLPQACVQIQDWSESPPFGPLRVAVNVSARQFRTKGFVDSVARVLRQTGLEPERLELELTEGVLIEDQPGTIRTLQELRSLGVQIAVDDFGTGYSSLSYLSRLPINCLKIDQSFVQRISTEKHDTVIIEAIISLAASLDLRVVAEGVETEDQRQLLLSHGCSQGQGFLFSKPLPVGDIRAFLSGIGNVIGGPAVLEVASHGS